MSGSTTLLPFQPSTLSSAQLAAVSYLARYSGHTHGRYAYQLRVDPVVTITILTAPDQQHL